MMATTITDRIAAWARLLPYDHSPAARRIGDRVPQHDGRTGGAQDELELGVVTPEYNGADHRSGHRVSSRPIRQRRCRRRG
jgi:hypothetical protein